VEADTHVAADFDGDGRADPAAVDGTRWYAWLFVLMPDHLHAILSFSQDVSMSRVLGDWKKYHEHKTGICWQDGYFDHRLRSDDEFVEKAHYIRMNPVRAGLCALPTAWPWVAEPWKQTT
jgi:putative transposase